MSLKKYINNLYYSALLITLLMKFSTTKWTIALPRNKYFQQAIVEMANGKRGLTGKEGQTSQESVNAIFGDSNTNTEKEVMKD